LCELENKEFRNLCDRFQSGSEYQFEEFLEMIDRMRKPFVCQIEGHEVSLAQDDCAIMMETSALRAITQSLFIGRDNKNGETLQSQQKRQQNGHSTVRTECGATGLVALQQTTQRNNHQSKQAIKKAKDKLERESKNIATTLTSLAALKQKKPEAYWVFSLQSSQQELSMILHLLAPDSGMISKGKQVMWKHIEDKLVPLLSQAAVDAKAEEYSRRLATVAAEIAVLCVQEQALEQDPSDRVETSADDSGEPSGLDEMDIDEDMPADEPDS